MESDDFFDTIDQEVVVANAEKINVYIRYANTSQGQTEPNGAATFKVGVPSKISCSTNNGYGFQHWAAFSSIPSGLTYVDVNTYKKDFADLELDSSIVEFADAESESTTVTVHEKADIYILFLYARIG